MGSIQELADDIYRERVLRARRTPIEQKLRAGAELFEVVCQMMPTASGTRIPGSLRSHSRVLRGDSPCSAGWSIGR